MLSSSCSSDFSFQAGACPFVSQVRQGAYKELVPLLQAEKDGASETFKRFDALIVEVAKEKNAMAFVDAIPAIQAYISTANVSPRAHLFFAAVLRLAGTPNAGASCGRSGLQLFTRVYFRLARACGGAGAGVLGLVVAVMVVVLMLIFSLKCSPGAQGAGAVAKDVAEAVIKAGYKNGKAKVVTSCRNVVLGCVEAGGLAVVDKVYDGLALAHPLPLECVKTLFMVVEAFGPYALGIKVICGKCMARLEGGDKKMQDAAQKLLLELCRWMGRPALEFMVYKLKDKDAEELGKAIAAFPAKPQEVALKPPRAMKVPPPPENSAEKYDFDANGNCVVDLVEPVDMLENLKKTDYDERVKAMEDPAYKWNEKVAAMELVIAACGSPPKLVAKDYSAVITKVRELGKDKMIAVAIKAFETLGVIADGMGAQFKSLGPAVAKEMMPRMKDAKLVGPAAVAMAKMYGAALKVADVLPTVKGVVFPAKPEDKMPPHTTVGMVNFLAACAGKDKIPMEEGEWADLTEMGVDIIKKVSDPKVKKANLELMVTLLAREKKEQGDGPVKAALAPLAEAKDSASKKTYKTICEAADPEGTRLAAEAAEAAKKAKEEEAAAKKAAAAAGKKKKADGPEKKKKKASDSKKEPEKPKELDMPEEAARGLLEELDWTVGGGA